MKSLSRYIAEKLIINNDIVASETFNIKHAVKKLNDICSAVFTGFDPIDRDIGIAPDRNDVKIFLGKIRDTSITNKDAVNYGRYNHYWTIEIVTYKKDNTLDEITLDEWTNHACLGSKSHVCIECSSNTFDGFCKELNEFFTNMQLKK